MSEMKIFTFRDLTLFDCWKIIKASSWAFIILFIICFFILFFNWGFIDESSNTGSSWYESVVNIWKEIPHFLRLCIIVISAYTFLYKMTSELLEGVGKFLANWGSSIKKDSFTMRLISALYMIFILLVATYNWLLFWGVFIVVVSLSQEYDNLKYEKENESL